MTPEMTQASTPIELNDALARLLEKYAVAPAEPWRLVDGLPPPGEGGDARVLASGCFLDEPDLPESIIPLLPWRHERRFVELKRLIDAGTVTPLLMCRFACLTDGRERSLEAILYREFDLIEWLSGWPIERLYASMAATEKRDRSNFPQRPATTLRSVPGRAEIRPVPFFGAANVIARVAGGAIASVEAGTTLPAGAAMQDRHELIARRGVASDRAVDTQVAQSSVYAWTEAGHEQHTDVDAELFGLDAAAAALVRAAYDALQRPESTAALRQQHRRLRRLVELAYESDRRGERLAVGAKKGTGPICAKHPPGRSGKLDLRAPRPGGTGVSPVHGQDARGTQSRTGYSAPPEGEDEEGGAS